jgi:colanic acid/amylovoran biosynthesis glycosyltransferase
MEPVVYVTARYPAITHTFIHREVERLRMLGLNIRTVSIRRQQESQILSRADRAEALATHSLLPVSPLRLLAVHGREIARHPRAYMATLGRSLSFSAGGVRSALWRLFYFAEALLLWDFCRSIGARHVHAHFANVACDVALLTAHYDAASGEHDSPLRFSFTMHGPTEFYDVVGQRLREKVEAARFVACISDYCRSQLLRLVPTEHWHKLRIVHCGVDTTEYAALERKQDERSALRLLAIGRLVADKGFHVMLEALSELDRRRVSFEATVIGDGEDRRALEDYAERLGLKNRVRFPGAVGQDRIRAHYAGADVFCLTSFAEGVPVVLMEAMATGLPVVATQIMGIPELIEDGVEGFLVPPARHGAVADALERLQDPQLRRRMGIAGRRKVQAEFDIASCADELNLLFRDSLDAS